MSKYTDLNKATSDARAERLEAWVNTHFKNQQEFIDKFSLNQGEISNIIKKKRVLGERKARKLEQQTDMPIMYLEGLNVNQESSFTENTGKTTLTLERFNKILQFLNKIEKLKNDGKLNDEHLKIIDIAFDEAIDKFDEAIKSIDKYLIVWTMKQSSSNEDEKNDIISRS